MNQEEIQRLYDRSYAAVYESKFLHSELAKSDAAFEVELLGKLLSPGGRWLDVACGTGYFLSQFPDVARAGMDLSPAMIELARKANPGVDFWVGDFRDARPQWRDQWDLVSCMWYAYGLVDSIKEVIRVLDNLADWTKPTGTMFLPISNPRQIARANYPYKTEDTPWSGEVYITGILWSYVEDGGDKVHAHQISLTPEYLIEILSRRFASMEFVDYPPALPGWEGVRQAIVAREKVAP